MATHSRVLTWRIPGTGEPGGLPSMESHGVGHDWSDLAAVAARYLKISFISRHTWMIAWLSRILDYQSYFGTAGSFFFLSILWGCHSAVLCWVLRCLHRQWNPRIFSQLPGVSPPMCAALCLAKKPAGLCWYLGLLLCAVAFSWVPDPPMSTILMSMSPSFCLISSLTSFYMPSLQRAPWRKPRWVWWLHHVFPFS